MLKIHKTKSLGELNTGFVYLFHQESTLRGAFSVIYPRCNGGRDSNVIDHLKYKSKHPRYAESQPTKCWGATPLNVAERLYKMIVGKQKGIRYMQRPLYSGVNLIKSTREYRTY